MGDDTTSRKARTVALFDRIARDYDQDGRGSFAHFGRRLVDLVGIEPGQRVLDVACGRGATLYPAAERVGTTGAVVGIDLAEGMVRATRREATRRGLPVTVRVMDAEDLAFSDATFDCVLCGFSLMAFPDVGRALGEFGRVLAPAGRLGVSTWRVSELHDLAAVLTRLGFADPRGNVLRFAEPDDVVRALLAAGFADVRVRLDAHTQRFADLEQYWRTALGSGMCAWLDTLDAAQTARVRVALADHLRPFQREGGIYLEAIAVLAAARR